MIGVFCKDFLCYYTRRKDCPKRLCHNDLNCPQRLIFNHFSVIVDNFSHCGIVVYSSFSSSVMTTILPDVKAVYE
jgi:hypothetical protein